MSLLDVLPADSSADPRVSHARFELPAAATPLCGASSGAGDALDLLAEALALVEMKLLGSMVASVMRIDRDGARQWQVELGDDVSPEPRSEESLWSVVDGDGLLAASALSRTASAWRLDTSDRPYLDVTYRSPLGARAVEMLAGAAVRVLMQRAAGAAMQEIDILTPEERSRLLVDWNARPSARPPAATVHEVFASVRAASPDALAVLDGARSMTYAMLDAASDALAGRLRRAGAGAGSVVGIAIPRSIAAVVAVLGVLKVGAAYLPLEASQPAERISFMLSEAEATLVVVDDATGCVALPADVGRIAALESATMDDGRVEPPSVDGAATAYVMYTSGSTGTPKGVEVPHRAILRLVCGVDYIELGPRTRMLHAAPLGFDASTLELWGPLLNGGCVVVHDEVLPTGKGLATTIARHGVTTAWLTAALFNAVVDDDPRQLAGLRELFTGGEALSVEHVRRMRKAVPTVQLHNGYGPTECTTFACTHRIDDVATDAHSIPIGRPIADTQVYVLNARLEPVPTGVVGELFIGGAGLAHGYLKRPDLTADRFVDNPFGPTGSRLYRTGDHVRYREDGTIEFVGRVDTQVKIRGLRIELGEIEAVLAQHGGVRACAVAAQPVPGGEKHLVAYVVAAGAACPSVSDLRDWLAAALPGYMVPGRYVMLDALPVTTNGKLDRRALPAPADQRPELATAYEAPVGAVEAEICEAFAAQLGFDRVGRHDHFFELGGTSLMVVRVLDALRRASATGQVPAATVVRASTALIFAHPTAAALARALDSEGRARVDGSRMPKARGRDHAEPIAIIAMAGRFPGADSVEGFWRNLREGRDTITFFGPDELDPWIGAERDDPNYVRARGVIDGVEQFDAAFFGIGPKEAELMDPQQRVFLELCWECLERGGHAPDTIDGPVGVFAGMYNATYYQRHVAAHPELIDKVGAFQVMLDNEKDYIATRVAHRLNLTGPAISLNTACSTSLVAICQAMNSLRNGECDMALAGGIAITCPPRSGYLYQEGSMLSSDGHTRAFDANAKGTVFSDGAAVVLLKRLSDAIADGDPVHALIRGGAINNDGGRKASFTAPSSEGQAAVIALAHDDAGVDPRSIGYVEAHGTATPLGDPIEIEGLTKAFRRSTDDTGFCRIGSLKSNMGHLVMAAGAAGVIKTALALEHGLIPASLHFDAPNPAIDFDNSPFIVNADHIEWHEGPTPRRAGVSSFGVGGTNAHVVLEQAPPRPESDAANGPQLLVLSARTPTALAKAAQQLADHLQAMPAPNLADVAWTLAAGRKAFAHRASVVAASAAEAVEALCSSETAGTIARSKPVRLSDVVFLFPGQGAQYAGMGRGLYGSEPAFREAFDECMAVLDVELGVDLRALMFGDDAEALLPTSITQPATFAIEYALARLWMSHGIEPAAMIGHSVGEFVAATLAGVFRLADALRLVARRGALMQAQPAGGMLSVRMPVDALLARLPSTLSLAAENAPGVCVVAGPHDDIARMQEALERDGIGCRALRTSHAFHSAMMDEVVAPFRAEVAAVERAAPERPIVSTATGEWLDAAAARSAEYWARHLREPVRFATALERVLDAPARVLLEVGPRATLAGLAKLHPGTQSSRIPAFASLADNPSAEAASFRAAAGRLWCHGVAIDPRGFDSRATRRRVLLPTYPFERRRFWVEASPARVTPTPIPAAVSVPESSMSSSASSVAISSTPASSARVGRLVDRLREVFEDVAGLDLSDADPATNFIELGLDSLMLTQVALQVQKTFPAKVTFRQLMGDSATLASLAELIDAQLPPEAPAEVEPAPVQAAPAVAANAPAPFAPSVVPVTAGPLAMPPTQQAMSAPVSAAPAASGEWMRDVIAQQMQLMQQQLHLLSAVQPQSSAAPVAVAAPVPAQVAPAPAAVQAIPQPSAPTQAPSAAPAPASGAADEEAALAHTKYDVAKAFGAIARIHKNQAQTELTPRQQARLDAFVRRYVSKTQKSKAYTQDHRPHLADPRVVNGFRPLLKEITYQVVVGKSKGSRLWDIDGNEYIDVLSGFGMNLFGWQPDFVLDAVKRQLDEGYEIGPQHPLAGEVAKLVCEVTGFDRAGLCNTGSEAVMGSIRVARTVTGRNTLVIFTGSYHGIFDEVIVRGTKKLKSVPAAPGILRNTAENVLVLDYGTPETLEIIRERAHEIAAVLVEPVQSRRPDFQPREFLQQVREITSRSGSLLIFDEVVTGFRSHPRGAQHVLGIDADLACYGKVVGGGFPIGVIAGKREYMDALDGGQWQFGDDSIPTVGVTYFAGTFVRHPLALAAAKAVLEHIRAEGPRLQEALNDRTAGLAKELNAFFAEVGAPIEIRHFASVWKTFFLEEHPLQDLLFAMVRDRGVHILDHFPCFFTTAHSEADFAAVVRAFKESVRELQEAGFIPGRPAAPAAGAGARPAIPGARLGREPDGTPAWFVPNPEEPGKYMKVSA